MSKFIDITGKRFNDLVVLKRVESPQYKATTWECLCDCGNIKIVRGSNLKNGSVKSCGCRLYKSHNATHNMSKSRLYRIWASMKNRCYNKNSNSYNDYGGRGIQVCEAWKNSFEIFYEWALLHGYSDELTIERIDNNDDYCPCNCKWIPFNEQQGNRRICYMIKYNGETKNLTEWCKELNISYSLVHNRIYKLGWDFKKAISEPVNTKKRNKKYGGICKK